jgi:hypothetical protein
MMGEKLTVAVNLSLSAPAWHSAFFLTFAVSAVFFVPASLLAPQSEIGMTVAYVNAV